MAEESVGTKDVISDAHTRIADNEMLKITFRRCHNFIHGNEGMPKDQAFWQFLYLIFSKMHDEKQGAEQRRFWAGPTEQFDPDGRTAIRYQRVHRGSDYYLCRTQRRCSPRDGQIGIKGVRGGGGFGLHGATL